MLRFGYYRSDDKTGVSGAGWPDLGWMSCARFGAASESTRRARTPWWI